MFVLTWTYNDDNEGLDEIPFEKFDLECDWPSFLEESFEFRIPCKI